MYTKEQYINLLNKGLVSREKKLEKLINSISTKQQNLKTRREKVEKEIQKLNEIYSEYEPISISSKYDKNIRSGSDKLYKLCNQVSIIGWKDFNLELSFLTHKTGKVIWDKTFKCMNIHWNSHYFSKSTESTFIIYDWSQFISNFEQKDILHSKIIKSISKLLLRHTNGGKLPLKISEESYLKEHWEAVLILS